MSSEHLRCLVRHQCPHHTMPHNRYPTKQVLFPPFTAEGPEAWREAGSWPRSPRTAALDANPGLSGSLARVLTAGATAEASGMEERGHCRQAPERSRVSPTSCLGTQGSSHQPGEAGALRLSASQMRRLRHVRPHRGSQPPPPPVKLCWRHGTEGAAPPSVVWNDSCTSAACRPLCALPPGETAAGRMPGPLTAPLPLHLRTWGRTHTPPLSWASLPRCERFVAADLLSLFRSHGTSRPGFEARRLKIAAVALPPRSLNVRKP